MRKQCKQIAKTIQTIRKAIIRQIENNIHKLYNHTHKFENITQKITKPYTDKIQKQIQQNNTTNLQKPYTRLRNHSQIKTSIQQQGKLYKQLMK